MNRKITSVYVVPLDLTFLLVDCESPVAPFGQGEHKFTFADRIERTVKNGEMALIGFLDIHVTDGDGARSVIEVRESYCVIGCTEEEPAPTVPPSRGSNGKQRL